MAARRRDEPLAKTATALTVLTDHRRMAGPPVDDRPPRYVAPLPRALEDVALRLAWPIVLINLAGTAFGFWYYQNQLATTSLWVWPWVPDSPLATLFMAISLGLWKLDRPNEVVNVLAFVGNIKLGLWTPFVLVVFRDAFLPITPTGLYVFMVTSHLAMVAQAFLVHRYSDFPRWALAAGLGWYSVDLSLDYFIPLFGGPHHTVLPFTDPGVAEIWRGATAFDVAAWAAVLLTIWAMLLASFASTNRADR